MFDLKETKIKAIKRRLQRGDYLPDQETLVEEVEPNTSARFLYYTDFVFHFFQIA